MNGRQRIGCISRHIVLSILFLLPSAGFAADVILHPGYIAGTVETAGGTVNSFSITATGGGYRSSKGTAGSEYSLTVQGGDWNYTVTASAQIRQGVSYYPYTSLTFSNRTFPVQIGETVANDYKATGAVRFHLSITGDSYSSWNATGYASKAASAGNEQTNSYSYTNSGYSPGMTWVMPVVPNNTVRIYAMVNVDGKGYAVWNDSTSYRYEDIAAGQTVDVYMNIVHTKRECEVHPENCQPPEYDYGAVQGTVNLDISEPDAFNRHSALGYNGSNIYSNPGAFRHEKVRTGNWTYRVNSYFDSDRVSLQWPTGTGSKLVPVTKNETSYVDFNDSTGVLAGKLRLTGTLSNSKVNTYSLYSHGASSIYSQGTGWIPQPTSGGYASIGINGTDGTDAYRHFLTGGYWNPYRFYMSMSGKASGYYHGQSLTMYDYNYYYDGKNRDFGQPAIITPGTTTVADREICFGSVTIRFRDDSGGTMSSPQVSGSGVHYNAAGKQDVTVNVSANHNITNAAAPEVELHGPPATYTLSSTAVAHDGTTISFPAIGIGLECGVRKCSDRKAPSITMTSPVPELITNAPVVTVSGTTTDEFGIQAVTVNGNAAEWWHTGNPDVPEETAFTYELPLEPGRNHIRTFVENTECNSCFDERNVYVDRWIPSVAVVSPGNGDIYAPNGPEIPVSVDASDRGYGYTLFVYLDGNEIGRVNGPADADAPAPAAYNGSIGPLSEGSHIIKAVAIDLAGNRAETTVTIVSNRPPVADAGTDRIVECAGPDGTTVTLDGSGSSDPDGDALTYTWTWNGGTASGVNPTVTLPLGTHEITLTVGDGKGGTAADTVIITIRDTTPPVTTVRGIAGTAGNNGWYRSDVTITVESTDSCSGVREIGSTVDGNATTTPGSTASIPVQGDGSHDVTFGAADNAGNIEEPKTLVINIDKTPPVITASVSPAPNANGWYATDVTVTFTCSDALSGIDSCTAPVTVTTEGAGQVVTGTATDKAGNIASASVTLNIDKTAPAANISVNPGLLWPPNHKMVDVLVSGGSSDGTSGVATVSITVTDEYGKVQPVVSGFNTTVPLEAWREGTDKDGRRYTITATITDAAGNTTTVSTGAVCPHDMRDKK